MTQTTGMGGTCKGEERAETLESNGKPVVFGTSVASFELSTDGAMYF